VDSGGNIHPISARLEELLEAVPDREFAGKLKNVYQVAFQTIARLREIDLVKYETTIGEDEAGLSLWEEMAPMIRDTVADVNSLLMAVHQQFPIPLAGAQRSAAPPLDRRAQRAVSSLHAASELLAKEITHLGERIRSPSVVGDRWNLLAVLQASRGGFREQIGNLLYMSAAAFGHVSRQEVVPGHHEEVRSAVLIRAAVADLLQMLAAGVERIRQAEPEDVQWHAQHLQREMDTLGRTPAYKALRAQDKRALIEFRAEIGTLAGTPGAPKPRLLLLVERFLKFAATLKQVNAREVLIHHDRDVWAACGAQIEEAARLLEVDPPKAAAALASAGQAAQALYGRDPELDVFLREIRRKPLGQLGGPELQKSLEKFRELVANASVF